MMNESLNTITILLFFIAGIIITWGFNRAKSYGKLGVLAWLQSVVLTIPWLIFFSLFAAGIYLNPVGIIFIVVASVITYVILGNRLRALGQNTILKEKAQQKIQAEKEQEQELKLKEKIFQEKLAAQEKEQEKFSSEISPIQDEDLKLIKGIFGIDTFFAIETIPYQEGAIFRGNLRGEPEVVHQRLTAKLQAALGDKYRLFLVESPEGKPVAIVLPSSNDPPKSTLAQKNLALVLLIATIFTSVEAAGLLMGFDLFNDLGEYQQIIPLALSFWMILASHEIGHLVIANRHKIRLSFPFFIPSLQIGSFGAITRFESLLPNRSVLFDIAFAGPICGGIVSFLMLVIGLFLSPSTTDFQIPTEFFRGSIFVGFMSRLILGNAMSNSLINIHPLTIIGMCGLVITSLNLLPAGQLDGGRMIQAIYGRKIARLTTITTIIILAIASLLNPNNPLTFYWGILILFLQRELERPNLNELTELDDTRALLGLLALFLALTILIPFSSTLADFIGIGG